MASKRRFELERLALFKAAKIHVDYDEKTPQLLPPNLHKRLHGYSTKPAHQAFADLHKRKQAHAENRAKHPPKPEANKEEKRTKKKDEKPLDKNDKTTPKSQDK